MRLTTLTVILLSALALAAPTQSYAKITTTTISWNDMVDACGTNNKSGGGHTGCSVLCGNAICDYDCQGTKCTKTVISVVKNPNGEGFVTATSAGMLQQPDSLPPPSLVTPMIGGAIGAPVHKAVP